MTDSKSSEDSDGAIHAYHGSRTVTTEIFGSLVGEAIPEKGPSASGIARNFDRCDIQQEPKVGGGQKKFISKNTFSFFMLHLCLCK